MSIDPVNEIKARLPIEELVGQYCQLKKKGRNFVSLCPFHNDSRPSMQISPDKGIAYCFACQTGGDIFSFYQSIEGVDFKQALTDLAEKTGVTIENNASVSSIQKDEKDQARKCLEASIKFYQEQLKENKKAHEYITKRAIPQSAIEEFQIGYAPDSFSDTYQYLLKKGFSRKEILMAGLGVQKELQEEKIYDRFRNRIMFPIHDQKGDIVGFGGRTIGEDDAKYINAAEGPLYNKSRVLYGLHRAKEAMRESKSIVMVEGYFDVIACHLSGVPNVAAVSGTALTDQHAKMLKRYAETVVLCLDQDKAGREAAERAFILCSKEGMQVRVVTLEQKDPDETMRQDPALLKKVLTENSIPYMDFVLADIASTDLSQAENKKKGLERLMPLLDAIATSVEKEHELGRAASVLGTTESAFKEDLARFEQQAFVPTPTKEAASVSKQEIKSDIFSRMEVALGLFFVFPSQRAYMEELIPPEEGFAAALYEAIKKAPDEKRLTLEMLDLSDEYRERAAILHLYCEHHAFNDWSDSVASREVHANCVRANREMLREKQLQISRKLMEAQRDGKTSEAAQLMNQYQQVLKLVKKAA